MELLIKKIIQNFRSKDSIGSAVEYMNTRGLSLPHDFGYIKIMPNGDKIIHDSLVILVRDILCNVTSVILRNNLSGEYKIQWKDPNSISIYGIDMVRDHHKSIILTESAIDSESINQHIKNPNVFSISMNSINVSFKSKLYFICSIFKNKNIITAFDNDESGLMATSSFISMAKSKFNIEIKRLDFPFIDLNEFLCKKGSEFFRNHLGGQL